MIGRRRIVLLATEVLLLAFLVYFAWRAHASFPRSLSVRAHPGAIAQTLTLGSGRLLHSAGMTSVYVGAGMVALALLAAVGMRLLARYRPKLLTLPQKQIFVELPVEARVEVIAIAQDFLFVACIAGTALLAVVQWHALGGATGAWPVPFEEEGWVPLLVAAVAAIALFAFGAVVFFRAFRGQVVAASRAEAVEEDVASAQVDEAGEEET